MTTIHLVRHGQTHWNAERRCQGQSDSELNAVGEQQAEEKRHEIEQLNITAIYSSTSVRARQTAAILSRKAAPDIIFLDSLREIYLGRWETRLWSDIANEEPDGVTDFQTKPHEFQLAGAENYAECRDRGVAALQQIAQDEPGGRVLVVSHGALLRATMTHFANIELSRLREVPSLGNCSRSVLVSDAAGQLELKSVAGVDLADTAWRL